MRELKRHRTYTGADCDMLEAEGDKAVVINVDTSLAAALDDEARKQGVTAEELALDILRARFLPDPALQPRDEWERGLLAAARDYGVSISNEALSRDELYDLDRV